VTVDPISAAAPTATIVDASLGAVDASLGAVDAPLAALRALVGAHADFRDGQRVAIEALVDDHARVLCVQRTGWGKSAVYFVATMLLRARGKGPTLLVSPLLALMRNQIEQAERGGIRAATINSDNTDTWDEIGAALVDDRVDILLVSPERFANPAFRSEVLPQLATQVGMFVIDEAHCISDWGHDFRPDYRRLATVLDLLPHDVPVLCTTATANNRVVDDITTQLGDDLVLIRGPLERESLALDVVHLPSQAKRLAWLVAALPLIEGCGIVYTLTVRDAALVAGWLEHNGIAAAAYFGAEESEAKQAIEARLKRNDLKVVVATSALSMGYDKPDLSFVVHFQSPGSVVAYYQQVGRAGRALDRAVGILLAGNEDAQIQDWFINTAFPSQEHAERTVQLLEESDGSVSIRAIEAEVNLRRTRLTNMLKQLEVEGAIERDKASYVRTAQPWIYPAERVASVTALRRAEQSRMRDYLDGTGCLMEHLRRELDDLAAAPCGRCSRCLGHPILDVPVDQELARRALAFLRGNDIDIEPRKQWADLKRIPRDLQVEWGKALSQYGDGGWGELARAELLAGSIGDDLVDALAGLVRAWRPDPRPTWVTEVPSLRRPDLVSSLATRVAARLGLRYVPAVTKVRECESQAEMSNTSQQAANVNNAFAVAAPVPDGPVLLVDDLVESRWTITTIGVLLREAGSGPVLPIVMARRSGD
jgi:ATP-dependent DNA helicase RecQ